MPGGCPLSYPGSRLPGEHGPGPRPGLVRPTRCFCWPLGISSQLRARSGNPGSFLGSALGGVARRGHGSPVFAGPPAALAEGELQRSLHCLDPHQGTQSVRGVRAQVGGRGAWPRLPCSEVAAKEPPFPVPAPPSSSGHHPLLLLALGNMLGFPEPRKPSLGPWTPAVCCSLSCQTWGTGLLLIPAGPSVHPSSQPARAWGLLGEIPAFGP